VALHHLWLPLLKLILLSIVVSAFGFFCNSWMLRVRNPAEGSNPFLLKMWLAVGATGPIFFILLKLHIFH
jgi:4-hydroxybenzoate polyprenyltransferase